MSVVEHLRHAVASERAVEFEAAHVRAGAVLTRAPECLDRELARRTDTGTGAGEDPDPAGTVRHVLRIRRTSASEHLQGFRQGPRFRESFAAIRPHLADVAAVRHHEVSSSG